MTNIPLRRIGIVGGVERLEPRLKQLAAALGHELEFHPGHVSGPASGRLRSLVERADLVVIVTEVNSHTAVIQARLLAQRAGKPVRIVRRLGTSQLRQLLPEAETLAAAA
jgi:predicted dehydrogenase